MITYKIGDIIDTRYDGIGVIDSVSGYASDCAIEILCTNVFSKMRFKLRGTEEITEKLKDLSGFFNVGDVVQIREDIRPGTYGKQNYYRHMLEPGSITTVERITYNGLYILSRDSVYSYSGEMLQKYSPKFRIGEKVRIKQNLKPYVKLKCGLEYLPGMLPGGSTAMITKVFRDGTYRIHEDVFYYTDDFLEKIEKGKENNMKNKELKVGSKVVIRHNLSHRWGAETDVGVSSFMVEFSGKTATITRVKKCRGITVYSLDIDNNYWNWTRDMFEEGSPATNKVVITTDGKTTIAKMYRDNEVVCTAKSKCSPEDKFEFEKGARLALDRMFAKDEENNVYTGKVICVDNGGRSYYTVGKTYKVEKGLVYDDEGDLIGWGGKIKSLDDLNEKSLATWIEAVE